MQSWFIYLNTFFWFSFFLFFLNSNNILTLLLYSELVWIILYLLSVFLGSLNDDINLLSTSFFLLGLAGLEFSIGLLIIVLFKNMKIDYNFYKNTNINNQFIKKNVKNLYLNRYIWSL